MIFPRSNNKLGPMELLEMCFTYGMQAEIDRGNGQPIALSVIEMPQDSK